MITVAMCLITFGACIRILPHFISSIKYQSRSALILCHIGQILNGISGPLLLATPPMLSFEWFPVSQRTIATSIAIMANYSGTLVCYMTVFFVKTDDGFAYLLLIEAMVSLIFLCIIIIDQMLFDDKPQLPPSIATIVGNEVRNIKSSIIDHTSNMSIPETNNTNTNTNIFHNNLLNGQKTQKLKNDKNVLSNPLMPDATSVESTRNGEANISKIDDDIDNIDINIDYDNDNDINILASASAITINHTRTITSRAMTQTPERDDGRQTARVKARTARAERAARAENSYKPRKSKSKSKSTSKSINRNKRLNNMTPAVTIIALSPNETMETAETDITNITNITNTTDSYTATAATSDHELTGLKYSEYQYNYNYNYIDNNNDKNRKSQQRNKQKQNEKQKQKTKAQQIDTIFRENRNIGKYNFCQEYYYVTKNFQIFTYFAIVCGSYQGCVSGWTAILDTIFESKNLNYSQNTVGLIGIITIIAIMFGCVLFGYILDSNYKQKLKMKKYILICLFLSGISFILFTLIINDTLKLTHYFEKLGNVSKTEANNLQLIISLVFLSIGSIFNAGTYGLSYEACVELIFPFREIIGSVLLTIYFNIFSSSIILVNTILSPYIMNWIVSGMQLIACFLLFFGYNQTFARTNLDLTKDKKKYVKTRRISSFLINTSQVSDNSNINTLNVYLNNGGASSNASLNPTITRNSLTGPGSGVAAAVPVAVPVAGGIKSRFVGGVNDKDKDKNNNKNKYRKIQTRGESKSVDALHYRSRDVIVPSNNVDDMHNNGERINVNNVRLW